MHTNQHNHTHTPEFKNFEDNMRGRLQGTRQIERERQTRESGIEASSDRGVRLGA